MIQKFNEKSWGNTLLKAKIDSFNNKPAISIEVSNAVSENDTSYGFINRKFYLDLDVVSLGEVEGWVEILEAKNEYTNPVTGKKYVGQELINLKAGNPIQIK